VKSMRSRKTEMTLLVTPELSNFGGNMHGGELLKLLDKVAFTCAMRYVGGYAVTLSVDKVLFKQAIRIGELLYLQASVNFTGRTSMEVGIRVTAEDLATGTLRHTNTSFFTMVAVDKDGKSMPVKPFTPKTEQDVKRWDAAVKRRAKRTAIPTT
jgi:acyl-CoA hydrolase